MSMSFVNSPTSKVKDHLRRSTTDDSNEAERQLCGAVDAMLAGVTRVLQQSASENAKLKIEGATASFLRANGIRIAQENIDESTPTRAVGRNTSGDAGAALRTQLERMGDLLRKVDGERRHLRKRCLHLQGEHDQRRTEAEAIHRYATASYQRSLTLERQVAEEQQRRQQLEEQLDTQTQELMRLRWVLRALPRDLVASLDTSQSPISPSSSAPPLVSAAHSLVPDRRFKEAFKDKMCSIVHKRRYRRASTLHQAASEQLEAVLMEQEDPQIFRARWPCASEGGLATDGGGRENETSGVGVRDPQSGVDPSNAAALASAAFSQFALDSPSQLPFRTTTPQDALMKSLIYHSRYAEPLTQLRDHTLRLCLRLHTTQHAGLRTLYTTFHQALRRLGTAPSQAQCRSLYERQMDKVQRAHRDLLYSLMEQVSHAVMGIPELERGSSGPSPSTLARDGVGDNAQAVQRRDVGCNAHESVRIEEYRATQLTKLKLGSLEAAAAALKEKEAAVAQCATARQEALQALQSLKKLTTCVMTAVLAQNASDGLVYDPLEHVREPLTDDVLDDPRLVTKIAEATDLTLTYVRQLARNSGSAAAAPVTSKAQVSEPRARASRAASACFSSSLTLDDDSARESTYGRIIDIHHRDGVFSEGVDRKAARTSAMLHSNNCRAVQKDRRNSAPSSLNKVGDRRSTSAAAVIRRRGVPPLPAVPKTPSAPTTKRGTRGRPEPSDASGSHIPQIEGKSGGPVHSSSNQLYGLSKVPKVTVAKPDDRNSNVTVSVIELGFSEPNGRT